MPVRKVSTYVPSIYNGYKEVDVLTEVEDRYLDVVESESQAAIDNSFIETAREDGVLLREQSLGIVADPSTETLAFRKDRLMNRFSMTPPFTLRFLYAKLDSIMGVGNWEANMDFANRTLEIRSSASDQSWYQEIRTTLGIMKPANLVYINVPQLYHHVNVSEGIESAERTWNYRMSSWIMGQKPFASIGLMGVIKMPETPSIQPALLAESAEHLASIIVTAQVLRGTTDTPFTTTNTVDGNSVLINYSVPPDASKNPITRIRLLDSANTIFTESAVYIDNSEDVIIEHKIPFVEGVVSNG